MTTLLDETRLTTLRELYNIERRHTLLALFEEQAGMGLATIAQALVDGDTNAVQAAAHRLAGCAANFACATLHASALRLAHPVEPPTAEGLKQQQRQLQSLVADSIVALREHLNNPP